MSGYVADTSVFVAAEQRRVLGTPPEGDARISVATPTELGAGVRAAATAGVRELREQTLRAARRFVALPYDELVAATALVHDLEIWTQDQDFDVLAVLAPELRVRRG